MSDFTTIKIQGNTGSGAAGEGSGAATWSDWLFGGTSGAAELRFCASSAGGSSTASANWPYFTLPGSVTTVPEAWIFSADTTGNKVTTYDATSSHYLQFRFNWDNLGTFASAPSFSLYSDTTHAAASPGTQPGAQSGSPIVNGQTTDTSSTAYMKANAYGYGVDTGGTQQTPSANASGTLSATVGTAGSVSPATGAWLSTWQSLQAATQYITDAVIPKATTAGFWYFVLALYSGPNMATSSAMQPVLTLSYTYV